LKRAWPGAANNRFQLFSRASFSGFLIV
jgi:hypothetical protein